jgi:hypothetical protein
MKIKLFGEQAKEIINMDNPQFTTLTIKSIEGRDVVILDIENYALDRYHSKADRVKE